MKPEFSGKKVQVYLARTSQEKKKTFSKSLFIEAELETFLIKMKVGC